MSIQLDNEKIMAAVVDKIAEEFAREDHELFDAVERRINAKIDQQFRQMVEPRIKDEIDKALTNAFDREYYRTNSWGEREGEPTSIAKELQKLMTNFWQEKVDEKGNPSSYSKITRAEYTMSKVLGEDFRKEMEKYIISSAAGLKDGLRGALRTQIDEMLGNLFRVRSGQDQAESRYV